MYFKIYLRLRHFSLGKHTPAKNVLPTCICLIPLRYRSISDLFKMARSKQMARKKTGRKETMGASTTKFYII